MMELLNIFLIVLFWNAASEAFENDANSTGWFLIFLSAFNGASLMAKII
jgi:hypothetical protein